MSILTVNQATVTNPDYLSKERVDVKSSTKINPSLEIERFFTQINIMFDQELIQGIVDNYIYLKELSPDLQFYTKLNNYYDYFVNEPRVTYLTDSDIKLKQWKSTTSIILFNINRNIVFEYIKNEHITHIASVFEESIINYHIYHDYEKISRETLDKLLDIEISILNKYPSQTIDFYYINQASFNPKIYLEQNKQVIFNRYYD
jgi:hypothetical protein